MNELITASVLKDRIKFGLSGAYFLFGEEEFMKQYYLKEIRKSILPPGPDADMFHKKISCLDFDTEKITDALTTQSMGFLEGKTLCELHEIQFKSLRESEWKALCDMLSIQSPDVVTVIYSTPDEFDGGILPKAPSKDLKRISEYVIPVNFAKEGEIKLAKWISKHFAAQKLSYETRVCDLMLSICGRDMFVLSGEIEKVCAYVKSKGETVVKESDVKLICAHNLELNAFDFSNALVEGNCEKAYEILTDMKLRKEKPIFILSSVTRTVSDMYTVKELIDGGMTDREISKELKMHEYKVGIYRKATSKRSLNRIKSLLRLCCETDIKLKSTSLESYTELDKLVILTSIL